MSSRTLVFVFIATIKEIFGVGFAFCQDPLVSVETIQWIKSSTVPVVCRFLDKPGFETIGSAFFINDEGLFMTANHVIKDWPSIRKQYGNCSPAIYIVSANDRAGSQGYYFSFKGCGQIDSIDIAICKPDTNPFIVESTQKQVSFVKFEKFYRIKDGTPIAITGFPLGAYMPITSKGYVASYLMGDEIIALDINAWPGNSGSPVYLSNGKVVGILIKGQRDEGGAFPVARSMRAIFKFLSKNNIRFYKDE